MVGVLPSPPVQEMPGFHQQAATASIERPAPFQERSGEMYQSPSSFQVSPPFGNLRQVGSMTSRHTGKTKHGDQPPPPPLSISKPLRRFWLYSLVGILSMVLIVSGAVLAKDMTPALPPVTHPTPLTLTRPSPTHAAPTQPASPNAGPTQPAPAPTQPASVPSSSHALQMLGGISLSGYCQSIGDSAASLDGSTAYNWTCVAPNGAHNPLSMTAACRWQYNNPQAEDRLANYFDPQSWECWG